MAKKQDLRIRPHTRHSAPHTSRDAAESRGGRERAEPPLLPEEAPPSGGEAGRPALREIKKHRRRGRSVVWVVASRLVLVGLLLAGGFALWKNWESLAPESLLTWIDEKLTGNKGGGYPVNIAGSTVLHMADMEGSLALLNDSAFTMRNSRGEETVRRPHTYISPMMKTAGKYALVAESNGSRLSLETRSKTMWNKTMEYPIVSAAVSKNGTAAVVTEADQSYSCELFVYNSRGKQLYRLSRRLQAVDVAVSPDGRQVAVVSIAADSGDIRSYLEVFRLNSNSSEPVFSKEETGMLLVAAAYLEDGRLAAVGDTALWIADPEAGTAGVFEYDARQLLGYAVSGHTAAVALRSYGSAEGGQVSVVDGTGKAVYTAAFTGVYRHMASGREGYWLLTGDALQLLGKEEAEERISLSDDGRLVSSQGNKAVILGLTTLTQVDLRGKGTTQTAASTA